MTTTYKSKVPTVMGVLSLIFGALGVCYNFGSAVWTWLFGGIADTFLGSKLLQDAATGDGAKLLQAMQECMAFILPWATRLCVVFGFVSIGLTIVGFGLVQRRAWARTAVFVWAGVAGLAIAFRIAISVMMAHRLEALLGDLINAPGLSDSIRDQTHVMSSLLSIVFLGAFPVVLVALVARLPREELDGK